MRTQPYYTAPQKVKRYSLTEIGELCKAGTVAQKPIVHRKAMRTILRNNIAQQEYYLQTVQYANQKEAYQATIAQLKKYLRQIPG